MALGLWEGLNVLVAEEDDVAEAESVKLGLPVALVLALGLAEKVWVGLGEDVPQELIKDNS